jgi:hypothetical protein
MQAAMNNLNSLSKSGMSKLIKEYNIDEKRMLYICEHIIQYLINNPELAKKIFITALDNDQVNNMLIKYFNSTPISRCHARGFESVNMMKNLLYIDGMDHMYGSIANMIEIFPEELLIGFITGSMSEMFDREIEKIIGKPLVVKYASSN